MDDSTQLLALRKELLVARAALQRLKIARDVEALREGLRWPRTVAAVAAAAIVGIIKFRKTRKKP